MNKKRLLLSIVVLLFVFVIMPFYKNYQEKNESKESTKKINIDSQNSVDELKVKNNYKPKAKYSREKFKHWASPSKNYGFVQYSECNVRVAAIARDAEALEINNCKISAAVLKDPYTGQRISGSQKDFDIDHIVPLSEAWNSGADKWDDNKRKNFANDSENLLATGPRSNRTKSDSDPAKWGAEKCEDNGTLPGKSNTSCIITSLKCDYAKNWIKVKSKYKLSIDQKEKQAITKMLMTCK